jgi:hypothetical protein
MSDRRRAVARWCTERQRKRMPWRAGVKGTISRRQGTVKVEFDLKEWSYLKSIILFARKASNGPLFANDVESPAIENLARSLLDELGFERLE